MKFVLLRFAAVIPLCLLSLDRAEGQELFRAGRPRYARAPRGVAIEPERRSIAAERYGAVDDAYDPTWTQKFAANDYRRVQEAWQAYVREADEFKRRYRVGFTAADVTNDRFSPIEYSSPEYSSQGFRGCPQRYRPTEPADYAPSLRPVNPSSSIDSYPTAPLRSTNLRVDPDPYYRHPARTASRSVADLLSSFLP